MSELLEGREALVETLVAFASMLLKVNVRGGDSSECESQLDSFTHSSIASSKSIGHQIRCLAMRLSSFDLRYTI